MERYQQYGAMLLRVSLGIIFIAHSLYLKIFVFTMPGTVAFFESLGFPGISAYVVLLAEGLGGILLVLGVRVRESALILALVSLGATWAHSGAGWLFSNEGGGWEYPLFLTVTSIVLVLLGPGAARVQLPESIAGR